MRLERELRQLQGDHNKSLSSQQKSCTTGHHSNEEMKQSGTQPLYFNSIQNICHFGPSYLESQSTPLLSFFFGRQILLLKQTQCVKGKDHFHRHAGSTTANAPSCAEPAFATGLTAGSCET